MKLISRHLPTIVILTILSAMVSCSKDEDPGPAGPAGAQGPAGPAGAQGPKGDSGTANVIYSDWQNVQFDSIFDSQDTTQFLGMYRGYIDVPKITQDILTKGDIHVYFNYNTAAAPYIFALPYADASVYINYRAAVDDIGGFIELNSNADLTAGVPQGGTETVFQFRYVLIPGGVAARISLDWKNYQDVKKFLGLKD
jgi:hypothetical protein